ncbi:MAG: hypothetical protein ACI9NC_003409 [Verrucomicrobiales bacterium]|jgi:hypothetical protein
MRFLDLFQSGYRVASVRPILQLALLALLASAVPAHALKVAVMPSYTQSRSYANAALNEPITVWGRCWDGTAPYSYTLDFGDGSDVSGAVGNPNEISALHTYSTGGSKTIKLTVTDATDTTVTRQGVVRVINGPTHDERVNMAIEKGLLYLYRNQIRLAGNKTVWRNGLHEYSFGTNGGSVLAFEENGHLPSNDYEEDIYAEIVQQGLNWIVDSGSGGYYNIGPQGALNPDTNGNGKGAYLWAGGHETYANSFAALAVIAAAHNEIEAKAMFAPSGPFAGVSYYDIINDLTDLFSYSQSDVAAAGWVYNIRTSNSGGLDGSSMQWPILVMRAAKDLWGLDTPAIVLDRTAAGFRALQNSSGTGNGGIGYRSNTQWLNGAKTGGALVCWNSVGLDSSDPNSQRAIEYIGRSWHKATTGSNSGEVGVFGQWYGMYGVKKGLQLMEVDDLSTPTGPRDWQQDFDKWLLGDASGLHASTSSGNRSTSKMFGPLADGGWQQSGIWPSLGIRSLDTAHAILIMTKSVTKPLPVAVIAPVPDQSSRFPAAFTLDGSGSYHLDSNASIVEYLWDLDASDGVDWNSPDANGVNVSVTPGWNTIGPRTVTLRISDDADPVNYVTTTIVVNVVETDVAPVAVPIPAAQLPAVYAGQIGGTIELDGSESFDPEGDPITAYAWDLDGNGTYGDAADAALDTTGNTAVGVTASLTYNSEYNGQIGLQVTSTPPSGSSKTSSNNTTIDVQGSASDLYVASLTATNINIGVSADIQMTLQSAADSLQDANDVVVRFYDGNPFTSGQLIGSAETVSIPKGESVSLEILGLPLNATQELAWVYVDSTSVFSEFDETNNTASVNVAVPDTDGDGLTDDVDPDDDGDGFPDVVEDGNGSDPLDEGDTPAGGLFTVASVDQPEGNSGTTALEFTVTYTGLEIAGGFNIDFTTADGTAVAPSDYQANSGTLTFAGTSGETQTVTVQVNGDPDFEPEDTFTLNIGNGVAVASGTGTLTNDDIGLFADTAMTMEDMSLDIDVTDNDEALPPDFQMLITSSPTNGSATVVSNRVRYVPDPHFSGIETVEYAINTFAPPTTANDDTVATQLETAIDIQVLANDSDPQGDPLTPSVTSPPSSGTGSATVNPNNTIHYAPGTGFSGFDSFTYQIDDGNGNTSSATVTVNVRLGAAGTVHYLPPKPYNGAAGNHSPQASQLWITTEDPGGASGRIIFPDGRNVPGSVPGATLGTTELAWSVTAGTSFRRAMNGNPLLAQTGNYNTVEQAGVIVVSDGAAVNVQTVQENSNAQHFLNAKGFDALGSDFYVGQYLDTTGFNFISVMAVEAGGTDVTFDTGPLMPGNWTGHSSQSVTVTLQQYETYIIYSSNDITGSHVTAAGDKKIVVNSGTTTGSGIAPGVDNGIDQLVPVSLVGTEYVVVRNTTSTDRVDVVATEAGTDVTITHKNGGPTVVATGLVAGQRYQINLNALALVKGDPVFIETTKPVYVYQNTGNSEVGMGLVAPVRADGRGTFRFRTTNPVGDIHVLTTTAASAGVTVTQLPATSVAPASTRTVPGRPDLTVLTFPTSASPSQEFLVQWQAFAQISMPMGTGGGGAFAYIGAFSSSQTQANDDSIVVAKDISLTFSPLLNDIDADGDPLSISVVSSPGVAGASVVNNGNGTVTYTPAGGYTGPDSFNYTITDGAANFASTTVTVDVRELDTATLTIQVKPVLDPPTLAADNASGLADEAIPLSLSVTLGADTDGSETCASSATLTGVPASLSFSAGARSGGDWIVDLADLAGLSATGTASGSFTIGMEIECTDQADLTGDLDTDDPNESVSETSSTSFELTVLVSPAVTPPGILGITIRTSNPSASLALFLHFEDGDDADDKLTYSVESNTGSALVQTSAILSADGILTLNTPCTLIGSADITVRATDGGGLFAEDTFKVTVIDDVAPVISGAKDFFLNAPAGGTATANFGGLTAWDKVDANPTLVCVLTDSFAFPIGSTEVTCTATDGSNNVTVEKFFVHVFAIQTVAGTRVLELVTLRGDAAPGAGGAMGVPEGSTLSVHYTGAINNAGDIVYSASMSNAGINNRGVFLRSGGIDSALAVHRVLAPGGSNYGSFSDLTLNGGGSVGFQSATSFGSGHFLDDGAMVINAATATLTAAGTTGEFRVLRKPAISSDGDLLTVSNLRTGVGGVTAADDTGLWRTSTGGTTTLLAREGSPSPIAATAHSQIFARVVASADNNQITYTSYLLEDAGFDPSDNTAIFAGPLGGTMEVAVREGVPAPGETSVAFGSFLGESVNSAGTVAFRGNVKGTGISTSNNEGIWWSDGTSVRAIAREGSVAPCLANQVTAFARFKTISNCDDGSVYFYAYLKDATTTPAVNSSNDGSIWRWDAASGQLHLMAREGDVALSTDGAIHGTLLDYDCNNVGGIVYLGTFVLNAGDTTSVTRDGVWLSRSSAAVAPVLVLRRGDLLDIGGLSHKVSNIKIGAQSNPGGGMGGYGKVINDNGEILLYLSLNRNKSGLFKLEVAP